MRFSRLTLRNLLIAVHDALATTLAVFASFYLRWRTRSARAEVGVISVFPIPLDGCIFIFSVDFDEIYLQPPQPRNFPAEIDNVPEPEPFDDVLRLYTFGDPLHAMPINFIVLGF